VAATPGDPHLLCVIRNSFLFAVRLAVALFVFYAQCACNTVWHIDTC
jgi:hypothetical protein